MSAPTPFHLLFAVLIGLLVAGCHAEPKAIEGSLTRPVKPTSIVDSAHWQASRDSLAVLTSAPDTFRASNKQLFHLQQISEVQYHKIGDSNQRRSFPADSAAAVAAEKTFLKAEAGRVWRAANTLSFRTNSGRIIQLTDGPTYQEAADSYEGYRYLDNLPAIQQWLVEVGQWEGRHYLLIDQQTGKKTELISPPAISPHNTYFACANSDPTGYSFDGLQLWQKPSGKPPKLRWQRVSNALHPGIAALAPRWKSNDTLYFYQDFIIAGRYMQIELH